MPIEVPGDLAGRILLALRAVPVLPLEAQIVRCDLAAQVGRLAVLERWPEVLAGALVCRLFMVGTAVDDAAQADALLLLVQELQSLLGEAQ